MSTHVAMVMNAQGAAPEPEQRPVPVPGAGEVLVKVNASSVNYHDMVNLGGLIWGEWPRVPMSDGAGEIVAIGPDVTDFSVGDRVMGAFHPDWQDGPPTPQAKAEHRAGRHARASE
jgi:NADPH:quinone reductase-like Zn-dependent oxidoreductase